MKRALMPTPLLDRARKFVRTIAKRRHGNISQLASASGVTRQQAHGWFIQLRGRPSASVALRALVWAESETRKAQRIFYPTWDELREAVGCLPRGRVGLADLARACRIRRQRMSDYMGPADTRMEPDGEIALRIYAALLTEFRYPDVEEKLEEFRDQKIASEGYCYRFPEIKSFRRKKKITRTN